MKDQQKKLTRVKWAAASHVVSDVLVGLLVSVARADFWRRRAAEVVLRVVAELHADAHELTLRVAREHPVLRAVQAVCAAVTTRDY